jgi:hypothetical protein
MSTKDTSSHPPSNIRWATIISIICFLIPSFFGFRLYQTALSLPPSLIDDMLISKDTARFFTYKPQLGCIGALQRCESVTGLYGNLGFLLFRFYSYQLSHHNPLVQHVLRLMTLCCIAGLISVLVAAPGGLFTLDQPGPMGKWRIAQLTLALLAGITFCVIEVPGWSNRQALQAHWLRLHTTDPPAALCLLLHVIFLCFTIRCPTTPPQWHRYLFGFLSALFLVASATQRPTTAAYAFCLVVIIIIFYLIKHPALRITLFVLTSWAILFTGYYLLLGIIRQHLSFVSGNRYGAAFSLAPSTIYAGWLTYNNMIEYTTGPLVPLVTTSFALRFASSLKNLFQLKVFVEKNFVQLYSFFASCCGLMIFLPWPHYLARYLFLFFLWAIIFSFIEVFFLLRAASAFRRPGALTLASLGSFLAGLSASLFSSNYLLIITPIFLFVAAALVRRSCFWSWRPFVVRLYVLGSLVPPAVFVFWSSLYSHSALVKHFSEIELFDHRVVEALATIAKREGCVYLAMRKDSERVAGFNMYLRTYHTPTPCVLLVNTIGEVSQGRLIMASSAESGSFSEVIQCGSPVWNAKRVTSITVPNAYDEWRKFVLTRRGTPLLDRKSSETLVIVRKGM